MSSSPATTARLPFGDDPDSPSSEETTELMGGSEREQILARLGSEAGKTSDAKLEEKPEDESQSSV